MSMRAIVLRAAGAFVMTTVLFAVAMVVAHELAIPDPVGRLLPPTHAGAPDRAEVAANDEQVANDLALTVERMPPALQTDDTPVAEVTAVPMQADPSAGDRAVALAEDADAEPGATSDQRRADPGDEQPVGQQAGAQEPAGQGPDDGDQRSGAAQQRRAPDEARPATTPAPANPPPDGGAPATAPEPQASETPQPTATPEAPASAPPAQESPGSPSPTAPESEPSDPTTQTSSDVADPAPAEGDNWWDLLFPGD